MQNYSDGGEAILEAFRKLKMTTSCHRPAPNGHPSGKR
jgi:hypothetical protein